MGFIIQIRIHRTRQVSTYRYVCGRSDHVNGPGRLLPFIKWRAWNTTLTPTDQKPSNVTYPNQNGFVITVIRYFRNSRVSRFFYIWHKMLSNGVFLAICSVCVVLGVKHGFLLLYRPIEVTYDCAFSGRLRYDLSYGMGMSDTITLVRRTHLLKLPYQFYLYQFAFYMLLPHWLTVIWCKACNMRVAQFDKLFNLFLQWTFCNVYLKLSNM